MHWKSSRPQLLALTLLVLLAVPSSRSVQAQMPAAAVDVVGVIATGDPAALSAAGVHWYLTFGFGGVPAAGMNRAAVVRLTPPPDRMALRAAVSAQSGQAWVIGNEPNVAEESSSDNLAPADYAAALHDLEALIHDADPSAIIVGPNVLNWVDTCGGCGGYRSGADWTAEFYATYQSLYGVRPPIDRWALHTYELDWYNTPTLHTGHHVRQLSGFRDWLESLPNEAGRPIWDTELGFHWAYPAWTFDADHNLVPAGDYDQARVHDWLDFMLNWLTGDGQGLGVERAFLYAQAPPAERGAAVYGGLALFMSNAADAGLTPAGKQLRDFLTATNGDVAPAEAPAAP